MDHDEHRRNPETTSRIVAAATDLFNTRGYSATTVEEVAEVAGVSRRTFFNYFPAKNEVLLIDHGRQLDFIIECIQRQAPGTPIFDLVWNALEDLARHFDADEGIQSRYRIVVTEPSVHAHHLQLQSRWDEVIGDAVARQAGGTDPKLRAILVVGSALACLRTCAQRAMAESDPPQLERAIRQARTILLAEMAAHRSEPSR